MTVASLPYAANEPAADLDGSSSEVINEGPVAISLHENAGLGAPRVPAVETAGFISWMMVDFIQPMLQLARENRLGLDNVDPLPERDRARAQVDAFHVVWDERKAQVTEQGFHDTLAALEAVDKKEMLLKKADDPWQIIRSRVQAGEYTNYKDLQRFQEDVNRIVLMPPYRALAPKCTRCKAGLCPLPDGIPELASLPPCEEPHRKLRWLMMNFRRVIRKPQPNLISTLLRVHKRDILKGLTFGLFQAITPFVPIVLLPFVNDSLIPEDNGVELETKTPYWYTFIYAAIVLVAISLMGFMMKLTFETTATVSSRIRGCLATELLHKALRISQGGWHSAGGHAAIFTLLHSDIERMFQTSWNLMGNILFIPTQTIIALGYLFYVMSWPTVAGLVVFLFLTPYNTYCALSFQLLLAERMFSADGRTRAVHELIENIRGVKFYQWEEQYYQKIIDLRLAEARIVRLVMKAMAKMLSFSAFAPILFQAVVLIVYAAWDEEGLTASKVYESLSLTYVIRSSFMAIPFLCTALMQFYVGLSRVQDYLVREEGDARQPAICDRAIRIENASFGWVAGKNVLENVNLSVKPGEFVMVVGKVGTGKSTLLSGLLQEVAVSSGTTHVGGRVAYCPQQPWIFSGTIRDNVEWACVDERAKSEERYRSSIANVALLPDLRKQLPDGDATTIGEKGTNISGGQKARVSLSRALYSDCEVYLLDDVLSAVDAYVGAHIFHHALLGQLTGKTRLLATNQMQFLPFADRVFSIEPVGDNGAHTLVEVNAADPSSFDKASHFYQLHAEHVRQQDLAKEKRTKQHPACDPLQTYPNTGGGDADGQAPQLAVDGQVAAGDPRALSVTVVDMNGDSRHGAEAAFKAGGYSATKLVVDEGVEEGIVTWKTYVIFFSYFGGAAYWVFIVFCHVYANAVDKFAQVWIGWYADRDSAQQYAAWERREVLTGQSTVFWFGIYIAIAFTGMAFILFREQCFATGAAKPVVRLYSDLLTAVLDSPLQFFDTTPVGRILTRFLNDWETVDYQIPLFAAQFFIQAGLMVAALLVVAMTIPYFAGMLLPVGAALYYILHRNRASLHLRRLFNVTKSPVSEVFAENLRGLDSIRAYGMQNTVVLAQEATLDVNHACFMGERYAFEWVRLRVNLLAAAVLCSILLLLIVVRDELTSSTLGLVISQGVFVVIVVAQAFLMRQQMDFSMNSAERVIEWCHLPSEEPKDAFIDAPKPPSDWPTVGRLEIKNMSVKYRPDLPLAIKNLNVVIEGGWKVGIVGRTGAGKSTVLKALFRLMKPEPGFSLVMDGFDATQLPLRELRKLFAIIPQEPVLFASTVRKNIDPFATVDDAELRQAVELCHLRPALQERAGAGGDLLEVDVSGDSLSIGQRQMLCLARALVMKRKFLLLDEATASVDVHTDKLIQETLLTAFKDCTVLTIAHRLNTITHSDRIMVLQSKNGVGQLAQFASYDDLVADKQGVFYQLAKEANLVQ
ncbi:ABC transporter C family member 3 [Diplonema papillatum]|nr:ABC transporter C family member 3 [Diplonema papillatum]